MALAALTAGLWLAASIGSSGATERAPRVGVTRVDIQSYTVTTTAAGRVVAYRSAEIRPQVDGILRKRLFTPGSHVEAGDTLYRIDPAMYQAAVHRAEAALAEAKAAVQSARPAAARARRLYKSNAVSQEKRDTALADLARAKAGVASARADLETARLKLGYTAVKAPIAGVIDTSNITVGGLVEANQSQALTTIRQIDPVYVDIQQSQTEYARLKRALKAGRLRRAAGDSARVRIDLGGNADQGGATASDFSSNAAPLTGRVAFTSASVDAETGSVRLRAVVDNPDAVLLPGMFVRAHLIGGVDRKAILVPQQAVLRGADGQAYCFIVGDDGTAHRRPLLIAGAANHQWRVTRGLAAGERIVVEGLGKIADGARVNAVVVQPNDNGAFVATQQNKTTGDTGRD